MATGTVRIEVPLQRRNLVVVEKGNAMGTSMAVVAKRCGHVAELIVGIVAVDADGLVRGSLELAMGDHGIRMGEGVRPAARRSGARGTEVACIAFAAVRIVQIGRLVA